MGKVGRLSGTPGRTESLRIAGALLLLEDEGGPAHGLQKAVVCVRAQPWAGWWPQRPGSYLRGFLWCVLESGSVTATLGTI